MDNDAFKGFLNDNSKFFSLIPNETKQVLYVSAEQAETMFKGRPVNAMRYIFEENGAEKQWDRANRSLAEQMSRIPFRTWIEITRIGEGNTTKYKLKIIKHDNA